jgi:preprotein translocase subunit YajC
MKAEIGDQVVLRDGTIGYVTEILPATNSVAVRADGIVTGKVKRIVRKKGE